MPSKGDKIQRRKLLDHHTGVDSSGNEKGKPLGHHAGVENGGRKAGRSQKSRKKPEKPEEARAPKLKKDARSEPEISETQLSLRGV